MSTGEAKGSERGFDARTLRGEDTFHAHTLRGEDTLDARTPRGEETLDARTLRGALGRFATGVTIITCVDVAGARVGLTANSFSALSLEPPLVLWSLRRASPSLAAFEAATHFAVNVLAESQVELSRRFATPSPSGAADASRFDAGQWSAGLGGAPVLAGCAAVFECERIATHDGGDHRLFIGRVLRLADIATAPLVFQGGRYHMLGEVL